jgi:hypothetical protein
MIEPNQFRVEIVQKALKAINLWSLEAEELLMLTAAQESQLGYYIKQVNGSALGVFQMMPETYSDIIINYLSHNVDLKHTILKVLNMIQMPSAEKLVHNLFFAAIMCRVHYLRIKDPIPPANNILALANYYKRFYNSSLGAATIEQAIANYNKFVGKK